VSKPKQLKGKTMTAAELDIVYPPVMIWSKKNEPNIVRPWMIQEIKRGANGGIVLMISKKKKLNVEFDISMEEVLRLISGEPVEH